MAWSDSHTIHTIEIHTIVRLFMGRWWDNGVQMIDFQQGDSESSETGASWNRKSWPRAKKRKGKRRSWWGPWMIHRQYGDVRRELKWPEGRGQCMEHHQLFFSRWLIIDMVDMGKKSWLNIQDVFIVFYGKPWISLLNLNQVWDFWPCQAGV